MIILVEYNGPVDENPNPTIGDIDDDDLKILVDKKLIGNKTSNKNDKIIPKFVGEVITSSAAYFSLPKNFKTKLANGEPNLDDVRLIREVLDLYSYIDGIKMNSTAQSNEGDLFSERYYYKQLKEYFLDYITYEFIYPIKRVKKHSNAPIKGGKINVLDTIKNRKQYGTGVTYDIKDVKNDDEWMIDDIYYNTLLELANKYATTQELKEIEEMKEYLDDEGYVIKPLSELVENEVIPNTDRSTLFDAINKSDVGIIHNPIKNILLAYYEPSKLKDTYKMDVFYVEKFQYVWEYLTRDALGHSEKFNKIKEIKDCFNKVESKRKWFPTMEEKEKWELENKMKIDKRYITLKDTKTPTELGLRGAGVYLHYDARTLKPDIFSRFPDKTKGKMFIGDAKYYRDPENSNFDKEFFIYNEMIDNKYPMVVFIPGKSTRVIDKRSIGDETQPELIVFTISVSQAIKDAVLRRKNPGIIGETLSRVHGLISKNTSDYRKIESNF